jgi:hypothetical protein
MAEDPTAEIPYMRRLLVALGRDGGLRVWRQNSGVLFVVAPDGSKRAFRAAPKGAADISGVAAPGGWRLEVETKSADGTQTDDQKKWQRMVETYGGIYVLCGYDSSLDMDSNVERAVARVRDAIARRVG